MYCPKCSQLQSSDEMRFCPRCGFALAGVALLVENEGIVPQATGSARQTVPASRKKVMIESAIFTGISWVILIVATAAFDFGGPFESLAKMAAVLFFFLGLIGLLRFLYGFLFVKDVIIEPALNTLPNVAAQVAIAGAYGRTALPGPRDVAAPDYPRRNTKDMMPRPSVTENTTRLLEEPIDRTD